MSRPPTACRTPGCSGLAEIEGLCATCKPKPVAEATPESQHDYHREWAKLYNCKRWHDLRAAVLRKYPICTDPHRIRCRAASTVADHVIDHRGNLVLFYSFDNLRGVCKPCHDKKTGSSHGGGNHEPPKPGLVDGRVKDYGPKVVTVLVTTPGISGFNFLAALNRHKNPIAPPQAPEVQWGYGDEDKETE